jgi:hypothetical protein
MGNSSDDFNHAHFTYVVHSTVKALELVHQLSTHTWGTPADRSINTAIYVLEMALAELRPLYKRVHGVPKEDK